MKKILTLVLLFTGLFVSGQNKDQVDLILDLTQVDDQSSYQLMYKRAINNSIVLRGGLSLFIDTDKEIRSDTLASESGTVMYNLSLGFQKQLKLDGPLTLTRIEPMQFLRCDQCMVVGRATHCL